MDRDDLGREVHATRLSVAAIRCVSRSRLATVALSRASTSSRHASSLRTVRLTPRARAFASFWVLAPLSTSLGALVSVAGARGGGALPAGSDATIVAAADGAPATTA